MILATILTFISPFLAWTGYWYLFIGRIILGFCHGVTFPVMHGLTGYWAPQLERSKMISIYVTGCSVGTCILFPIAGMIISQWGWPYVFYSTGLVSFIWVRAIYNIPFFKARSQNVKILAFEAKWPLSYLR